MQELKEFNDEILNQEELGTENSKEDGIGSWDEDELEEVGDEEVPGPEQDEESVLNADVVLAEPGLKQDILQSEVPDEEINDQEDDQKNTPQDGSRRVLSFTDYFSSSR